jgi:uncharacterized repeat protein (TIGR01451 family)
LNQNTQETYTHTYNTLVLQDQATFNLPAPGNSPIMVYVGLVDASGNWLASGSYTAFAIQSIPLPTPDQLFTINYNCNGTACMYIGNSGGGLITWPATIYVDGVNYSATSAGACQLAAGTHDVVITTSNGCISQGPITLSPPNIDSFSGLVFSDVDGNTFLNSGVTGEHALSNVNLTIVETQDQIITDNTGTFDFNGLAQGTYHLVIDVQDTIFDNPDTMTIQVPGCSNIGLNPTNDLDCGYCSVGHYTGWTHCVAGQNVYAYFIPTLNAQYAQINITHDPSVHFTGSPNGVTSTENGNTTTFNFSGPTPFTQNYAVAHFSPNSWLSPGTQVHYSIQTIFFTNTGDTLLNVTESDVSTVFCSYDPNEIVSTPEGYSDERFVLPSTEMEYTIRFKNTGSAAAINVRVDNQIDASLLDLSSFELVNSSHQMHMEMDGTGLAHFYFDNIQLPDSTSDQEGSHGELTYRIRVRNDAAFFSVINNTASIFFDANEAVITNTDMHVVYNCDHMQTLSTENSTYCQLETLTQEMLQQDEDTYTWTWDGEVVSTSTIVDLTLTTAGDHTLELISANPLCSATSQTLVHVGETPGTLITTNEIGQLIAPDAAFYQWFLDGQPLNGFNSQIINPIPDAAGIYTFVASSLDGCVAYSEAFEVTTGVAENQITGLSLYPNPTSNNSTLNLGQNICDVRVYSAIGQQIRFLSQQRGIITLDKESLSQGTYVIRVTNASGQSSALPWIIR